MAIQPLRPYQKQAADAAVACFLRGMWNGLLVMPTASGKAHVIADIASRLDAPLLVFAPTREIVLQNYDKIRRTGMADVGIYSASLGMKNIRRITLATIGSVHNHMNDFRLFKYVIVDEAHRVDASGGMYKDYLTARDDRCIIGLTATPYRLSSSMGYVKLTFLTRMNPRIYDRVLYVCQVSDMMDKGYLSRPRYFDMTGRIGFRLSNVKLNTTGMDYDEESLEGEFKRSNFASDLLTWTLMVLCPNDGSKRNGVLVFTRFIREAEVLTQGLRWHGISAETVTSKTSKDERQKVIEDFRSGKITVCANAGCLDTQTEILTREGWVGIDTITGNEHIAQYDNGNITFSKPMAIIKNESYKDDFVSVKGQYMNIRVTKDHRMVYTSKRKSVLGEEYVSDADSLVGKHILLPISGFAKEDELVIPKVSLPCSKRRFINYNAYNYRKKGISYSEAEKMAEELYNRRLSEQVKSPKELTLDECRFIGFFICDGNIFKAKKNGEKSGVKYTCVQSLANPHMIEWIESLLDRCGIAYSYCIGIPSKTTIRGKQANVSKFKTYYLSLGTGGNGQYNKSNLHKLLPYLEKQGSDLFWALNREQFWAVTEGMFKANGEHGDNKEYHGERFIISNKPLADLIQAVGVCRGYRVLSSEVKKQGAQTLYRLSVGNYQYHELVNERLEYESHEKDERTWCVSVPTGKIVTRRNGRVTIVGNCLLEGFDYPALDTVIIASPTRSLSRWCQMLGRVVRPFEGKEPWVVDLSGNYRAFGKIEDLKIENVSGVNQWVVTSRGHQLTGIIN